MKRKKALKFVNKLYEVLREQDWVIHKNNFQKEVVSYEEFASVLRPKKEEKVFVEIAEQDIMKGTESEHIVRKYADGSYSCTCKLFENMKAKAPCHHILLFVHRVIPTPVLIKYSSEVKNLTIDYKKNTLFVPNKFVLSGYIHNMYFNSDSADLFYTLIRYGWQLEDIKCHIKFEGKYSGLGFMKRILRLSTIPESELHRHLQLVMHEDTLC